jgi:hypothetical protein
MQRVNWLVSAWANVFWCGDEREEVTPQKLLSAGGAALLMLFCCCCVL